MADDPSSSLFSTSAIASSGMQAENARMKIIAENIANANNTASTPGGKPYQRQVITFKSEFDKALGAYKVKTGAVRNDNTDFIKKYEPSNPGADASGYVLTPNVNSLIEMMDLSDAPARVSSSQSWRDRRDPRHDHENNRHHTVGDYPWLSTSPMHSLPTGQNGGGGGATKIGSLDSHRWRRKLWRYAERLYRRRRKKPLNKVKKPQPPAQLARLT